LSFSSEGEVEEANRARKKNLSRTDRRKLGMILSYPLDSVAFDVNRLYHRHHHHQVNRAQHSSPNDPVELIHEEGRGRKAGARLTCPGLIFAMRISGTTACAGRSSMTAI
jgi:hypothetical protein